MLRRLFHWLFDRHADRSWGTLTSGPLDEEPPPIRNWGDAVSNVRRMDEPRPRDVGGMTWDSDED